MSKATEAATALARDLLAVLKKHKVSAQSSWTEVEPNKVIFTATITSDEAKVVAAELK